MDLVPLKVEIGLRANGHADHPDWTLMPMVSSHEQVRQFAPFGWMYDKASGHNDDAPGSPLGIQYGMLLTTRAFADEALATFPALIVELTEQQAQEFFDNRVRRHIPENRLDSETLTALNQELQLKKSLGQSTVGLEAQIEKALDPEDSEPGVRKNEKRWAVFKSTHGFTIP